MTKLLSDDEIMTVLKWGIMNSETLEGVRRIEAAVIAKIMGGLKNDDLDAVELDRAAVAIARRVMDDTQFKKPYMVARGALPHRWVVEAVMAGMSHAKFIADQQHQAIEEGQAEQHDGLQTSLIRAGMAAVCEAVMDSRCTTHWLNPDTKSGITVNIDLDAQRTIWDRVDLDTSRNPEETEVIFTITRK